MVKYSTRQNEFIKLNILKAKFSFALEFLMLLLWSVNGINQLRIMYNIIIRMTSGFYAIIWKDSLWFPLCFFSYFSVSDRKERERPHNFIRIAFPLHKMECSENMFSSSVILSGHKIFKKDLLKLSLLSNKIYLAEDLLFGHCLWSDLSKVQISLCLFFT